MKMLLANLFFHKFIFINVKNYTEYIWKTNKTKRFMLEHLPCFICEPNTDYDLMKLMNSLVNYERLNIIK